MSQLTQQKDNWEPYIFLNPTGSTESAPFFYEDYQRDDRNGRNITAKATKLGGRYI